MVTVLKMQDHLQAVIAISKRIVIVTHYKMSSITCCIADMLGVKQYSITNFRLIVTRELMAKLEKLKMQQNSYHVNFQSQIRPFMNSKRIFD